MKHHGGIGAATLAATLAIAVAGCGSSSSSGGNASSAGRPSSAQLAKFTACLKQHGVTVQRRPGQGRRPGAGGNRRRPSVSSKQRQAFQACRKYMPAGRFGGRGRPPGNGGPGYGGPGYGGPGGPPPGAGAPPGSGQSN